MKIYKIFIHNFLEFYKIDGKEIFAVELSKKGIKWYNTLVPNERMKQLTLVTNISDKEISNQMTKNRNEVISKTLSIKSDEDIFLDFVSHFNINFKLYTIENDYNCIYSESLKLGATKSYELLSDSGYSMSDFQFDKHGNKVGFSTEQAYSFSNRKS